VPDDLVDRVHVGGVVKVPFGRVVTHGYVIGEVESASKLKEGLSLSKLKKIISVELEENRIPKDVLELSQWASRYYFEPLGEVLNCAVPASAIGLKNKKKTSREIEILNNPPQLKDLSSEQSKSIEDINQEFLLNKPVLLHGVTGSGKTEVYLHLATKAMAEGKSVLILAPEIALTPQLHQRLEDGLGTTVALWHSALTDAKRRDYWLAMRKGKIKVLVGARSAVFAPLQNLGLIVVDEEHDSSYKQEGRMRYHARDLSLVRAKVSNCNVLLGSATPSLETLEKVKQGRFGFASLPNRISGSNLPKIEIVDLLEEQCRDGLQAQITEKTITAIRDTIEKGQQVMIFLNRRGYAAFLLCEECGAVQECPNCSVSLTVHKKNHTLRCHYCDYKQTLSQYCTQCSGGRLKSVGAGTESIETELPRHIKNMIPIRLDRDQVTSASRLSEVLEDFRCGKFNTLVGTQMLVKGHDFSKVTLVVVILADSLFRWPEYRSSEKALQVLTQVAGRAGRGKIPGKVLIQTYAKDHPVIQVMTGEMSEEDFLNQERSLREALNYPPFARFARLRIEGRKQDQVKSFASKCVLSLNKRIKESSHSVEVLGPSEAFIEKVKSIYRWDALIKAKDIKVLQEVIFSAKSFPLPQGVSLIVDIDPVGVGY